MKLHVVSFNVPYPADYGGVIDVFYRLKALKEAGAEVILHCFTYGREPAEELKSWCSEVHYYQRRTGLITWLRSQPYIIAGRDARLVLPRLLKDEAPVLLEGFHCTGALLLPELKDRKMFVRMHNVEKDYYRSLGLAERNPVKKLYLLTESRKLRKAEHILDKATGIFAISPGDVQQMREVFGKTYYLPPFHPYEEVQIPKGKGSYALYHGNLSVGENDAAALFLVNEVFKDKDVPLVIAGRSPSPRLVSAVAMSPNIRLVPLSTQEELQTLMRDAQVNILPTFQTTGVKLKLLAALYEGRHCVVNREMVAGSSLAELCLVGSDPAELYRLVKESMSREPDEHDLRKRREILMGEFSNKQNAENLLRLLSSR
ncbi:MAG: glycosyltransferase [Bacteroidia bacterium]|nr:glycosyltransferase [Bacteroidia bacterium]